MDIQLADVLVHIDQDIDTGRRAQVEESLRAIEGVVSVHNPDDKPHLSLVGYDPNKTNSTVILDTITAHGVHAELIGL